MTPVEIETILHFYYCADRLVGPTGGSRSPAQDEAIRYLYRENMIQTPIGDMYQREYVLTNRGEKYVDMLLNTPLPEFRWIDPRFKRKD